MRIQKFTLVTFFLLFSVFSFAEQYSLTAKKVQVLPEIDGIADPFWNEIPGIEILVKPVKDGFLAANPKWDKGQKGQNSGNIKVQLKAVHDGKSISFLATWPDSTKDDTHTILVWDKDKKEYVEDKSSFKEDRFVFAFGITDNFCGCMVVAEDTIHDIWHWKAYRTNELGYLDDKRHVITSKEAVRATKVVTPEGKTVWLRRPRDYGLSPYFLTDVYEYQGDRVPKNTIRIPRGRTADVTGKGKWSDGVWTLETLRKFNTGDPDDIIFTVDKKVKMAVSVFNRVDAHRHSISEVMDLDLE